MRSLTRRSSERAPDKPTGWKEASVHWSRHCPESMFEKLQGSFQDRLNRHFVGAAVGAMPRQKKRLSEVKWQVWVVCDRLNPPMWPVEPTLRAVSAQQLVTALLFVVYIYAYPVIWGCRSSEKLHTLKNVSNPYSCTTTYSTVSFMHDNCWAVEISLVFMECVR